jgi:hypothetical protein
MSDTKHPFLRLSDLIQEYYNKKESFSVKELQDMRENISLTLFYLSDSASTALSKYDKADWERKRSFAELIEENKYDDNGDKNTVAVMESLARIANKEKEEAVVEALRQKERVRIILNSTQQILNAIASRLSSIQQK